MSPSSTRRSAHRQSGFSLIETMIAITVLAVGMLGVAAMLSNMDMNTGKSRYMSLAALLASEKLEELNRYPNGDDNITVADGAVTAGSLTTDMLSASGTSAYYDQVSISTSDGKIAQTTAQLDTTTGQTVYAGTAQSPDGKVVPITTPPNDQGTLPFKRRWLIEKDVPVVGVCRITVLANLENASSKNPIRVQMSMVRQYAK